MRRRILFAAATLAAAAPSTALSADRLLAPASACPNQNRTNLSTAKERAVVTCMVNWARAHDGKRRLRVAKKLVRSAQAKTNLIARCGVLTHEPCGQPWNKVFSDAGYHGMMFENIASGSGRYGTPRGTVEMWLGSPGHRSAMLDAGVTQVGVGVRMRVRVNGYRGAVWTLHLGRPR